jgi:hypothetical protein
MSERRGARGSSGAVVGRPRRRTARRRVLRAAAIILVLCVTAAAWVIHGTRYESRPIGGLSESAGRGVPAWSRPCLHQGSRSRAGISIVACVHIDGRVVYRQRRDPDGDGDSHLLVLVGAHLLNLKFPHGAGVLRLPAIGRRVVATGLRYDGRSAIPKVEVLRLG